MPFIHATPLDGTLTVQQLCEITSLDATSGQTPAPIAVPAQPASGEGYGVIRTPMESGIALVLVDAELQSIHAAKR